MNELEDIKLKALLQNLELNSPRTGFSVRVMNKIFEEESSLEQIKSERILGKGFWIITVLFIALLVAIFILSNSGMESTGVVQELLPEMKGIDQKYASILSKLGSLPLGVGGCLAAFSILLFIDRFISSNSKVFA